VYTYRHRHIYLYISSCTYIYIYPSPYIQRLVQLCVYISSYTYIYTYLHIRIYIYSSRHIQRLIQLCERVKGARHDQSVGLTRLLKEFEHVIQDLHAQKKALVQAQKDVALVKKIPAKILKSQLDTPVLTSSAYQAPKKALVQA